MRVLLVHNEYLQRGGEDTVFGIEKDLLESHGNEVETLTFNNADIASFGDKAKYVFKSIYNSDAYKKMEAKIKSFNPDVIHVHNFFYVASPSIFYAAKDNGVPIVQTLHNYRLICPSAYLYHNGEIYEDNVNKIFPVGAIMKKVWNNSLLQTASIASITAFHKMRNTFRDKVDGFIVFTEFAKNIFLNSSLQVPENKFFIKPNFTDDFGYNGGERGDYYLFIGRLSEEKGIDVLLDSAEHYDFKLKILGDGPLKGLVESRAASNPNIDYLGRKPKPEVIEYLKSAKALLFTSKWYEGMPMVIVESFSTGTPVITCKLGNPQFIVEEGINGLHFEPKNPIKLAEVVRQFDEDPAMQKRLSDGARNIYETKYSSEKNYRRLIEIYQQVSQKSMAVS